MPQDVLPDEAPFKNRQCAGRALATLLNPYADRNDLLVLGLPRGGVPVALEVARELGAPLDVLLVRKLGVPGHSELAMGAIAGDDVRILNENVVHALGIPESVIDSVERRERGVLEARERLYRNNRPALSVHGRTVIIVDDGLATGATMQAAVTVIQRWQPAAIVIAVPAAARDACEELSGNVDACICAIIPENFYAVGAWYEDFDAVSDEEVTTLLAQASAAHQYE